MADTYTGRLGNCSLVSPYLVPTREGMRALTALAREGIDITILTNSLEAIDAAIVHAGY